MASMFAGRTALGAAARGAGGSAGDVDVLLSEIDGMVKAYGKLCSRVEELGAQAARGGRAKKTKEEEEAERLNLMRERDTLKARFIEKKQAVRANIALIPEASRGVKENTLKGMQTAFRDADAAFKQLGGLAERGLLLASTAVGVGSAGTRPPTTARLSQNDEYLNAAIESQKGTTAKLKEGLSTLETTKVVAGEVALTLEEDREKIAKVDRHLDEMQSDLVLSQKLMSGFMKRLYTDKVFIAMTALVVLGLAGIIIYATMKPGQSTFTVPDAVKPPLPPAP